MEDELHIQEDEDEEDDDDEVGQYGNLHKKVPPQMSNGDLYKAIRELQDDYDKLHNRYFDVKQEITKLKTECKTLKSIIAKHAIKFKRGEKEYQDALLNDDSLIKKLRAEIAVLKARCSTDNVLHTRKLPDLQVKRPYKGGNNG